MIISGVFLGGQFLNFEYFSYYQVILVISAPNNWFYLLYNSDVSKIVFGSNSLFICCNRNENFTKKKIIDTNLYTFYDIIVSYGYHFTDYLHK